MLILLAVIGQTASAGFDELDAPVPPVDVLVHELEDEDAAVRRDAAQALGRLGPEAKAAVPALLRVANRDRDRRVAESARDAIVAIGEAAVPGLVDALGRGRTVFGWAAGSALARIGAPAVPSLIELLAHSDDEAARWEAVNALRLIGAGVDPRPRRQAVSALGVVLREDGSSAIRAEAAKAIGLVGSIGVPAVDDAVPSLLESVQDEDASVRAAVVEAIGRIQRVLPEGASRVVLPLARDADAKVRAAVASAIPRVAAPVDAVPVLARMLDDPKRTVRRAALKALAAIGPEASPAMSGVTKSLASDDRRVRILAADAAWRIEGRATLALPALIAVLDDRQTPDRHSQDRLRVIRILGDMGAAARPALPALRRTLDSKPPAGVAVAIRKAIAQIDDGEQPTRGPGARAC